MYLYNQDNNDYNDRIEKEKREIKKRLLKNQKYF